MPPFDLVAASGIAEEYVRSLNAQAQCPLALTSSNERPFGWVFSYGPTDPTIAVAGNAPFIVDRHDGSIHVTGTAHPLEMYLESYALVGRTYPFAEADYLVHVTGWKPGFLKISFTKAILVASSLGLADAKRLTDELLAGTAITLVFGSEGEADHFCDKAHQFGTFANRGTCYR